MLDMFADDQRPTIVSDLFGQYNIQDKFLWAVGVFAGNGAIETLKYAIAARLETFFPYKINKNGKFTPLWRNYLFIEHSPITNIVCRQSNKFLGFINFDGQPELVYRNAIDECLKLLEMGKYNFSIARRAPIGKGSYVRVTNDPNFDGKMVKLLCDIPPDINTSKKVPVELGHFKIMIEVRKLLI